ncbi:HlyD family efflux transporter periplasmic adaptor subunit [Rhodoblastus acidophilus]|uniref:HlyD family efflux transporter periplasmic adaptor subunit n=1 Tax=Candidatus Rhodoblastus alkanivorans TaxID=2954117 RepID=A0ABS9Z361_9HYPH|nr:HlyD family efflux transporter periplasmic adaptor subunit [Candidatus Rhodoblastus alkanivorans]MCI4677308.1 HlyD family efflux transporter periplasmic adaptor subunit [Candidatus Rhodoblastus alkanivorans]MCI4682043.1 HlyD family efflux transporter periplasmic adaptor subunit [Candidatus Rhodoblastus alkanivorans]MDI4639345.1 HlyD family efflux transporter periplasmic adaptor subunit [Rhodoblastus acidophilus]
MGVASFHSLGAEDRVRAESIAWARFSSATRSDEFFSGWLAILCSQLDRAEGGLLVLGPDASGSFAPVAFWPHASHDLRHLGAAAQRVLDGREGVILGPDGQSEPARDQPAQFGYPIEVAGKLKGAVVVQVGAGADMSLQRSFRLVHWSSAWLVDHLRQQHHEETNARLARMGLAMDLAATILREPGVMVSALAIANELAVQLPCDRVSIGLERDGDIELTAISHTAVFNPKMAFARSIGAAMEEALDLDAAIVIPPLDDAPPGAAAHADLVRDQRDIAICSVPMRDETRVIGVVTAERTTGQAFDKETVELMETVAALLAPIIVLKQRNERGLWRRLRDAGEEALGRLLGSGHLGLKLIVLTVAALTLFFSFYTTTYRVSARAVLEGRIQRAAVAPFDGHIADSYVRAGDVVRKGQVLARLDNRDLRLERTRLLSDLDQVQGKLREAQAKQDRGAMAILAAQIKELQAQLALNQDRLNRANLIAPFDGVVVSGDLSQLLDTPVEQGKLLFQISPLESYRVILQVDERDISNLSANQKGALMLSGLPGQVFPFVVQQVTPVSTTQEGLNYFRVEAHLNGPIDRLRPGMEGVGKVDVGRRRLIWIWTHSLFDWLRMWAWKEAP